METSQKTKIAEALLKSQREIKNVKPDSINPRFTSGYASLAAVIGAVKDILNANDIVVIQNPIEGKDGLGCLALETILMHVSGESISSICVVPLSKGDAQAFGSALTYARRYALASMTGLATHDDDANDATATPDPRVKAQEAAYQPGRVQSTIPARKPPTAVLQEPKTTYGRKGYISEKQGKRLWAITKQAGVSQEGLRTYLKKTFNIEHSPDIKWQDYEAICKAVESGMLGNHGDEVQEPAGQEDEQFDTQGEEKTW